MRLITLSLACSSVFVSYSAATADVGFRIGNSTLVTWLEDDTLPPPTNWVQPERVFDGEMVLLGGIISINDPGFHGEDGTLTGFHLGFNVLAAARMWNVAGQNFNSISPLTLTMSAPLVGSVTTPLTDPASPIAGPSVLVPAGEFDFHYDYILNGTTPGLYLLKLQITTDKPGIAASLPYWVVENYGMSAAEHDASIQWVRDNLLPAPSAGTLFLISGTVICRRRRRQ